MFFNNYILSFELHSLLFIRTRTSIKYFPKFITMLNIMFLFYLNSYMYGASFELAYFILAASVFALSYFLLEFEHPAMTEWNPFDANTPRFNVPRMGYQLVLDDTNFGTGFSLWHAFMPLAPRQQF